MPSAHSERGRRNRKGITRRRTGCLTCRQRRIRCDEGKPSCDNCARLDIACAGYARPLVFVDHTEDVSKRVKTIELRKRADLGSKFADDQNSYDGSAHDDGNTSVPVSEAIDFCPHIVACRDQVGSLADEIHRLLPDSPPPSLSTPLPIVFSPAISSEMSINSTQSWTESPLNCTQPHDEPANGEPISDASMSDRLDPELPKVFHEVWQSIGYAEPVLKHALLAVSRARGRASEYSLSRQDRYEQYILSLRMLQSTADFQLDSISLTRAGVLLTVLALFMRTEILLGSYRGGRAHYGRGDRLLHTHFRELTQWELGKRILAAWISVRCWYSVQQFSGSNEALPLSETIREPIMRVLADSSQANDALMPLLCESYVFNDRVLHARLVGAGPAYPSFRSWRRTLQTLRTTMEPKAFEEWFPGGTEASHLAKLRALQHELDVWHDRLPLCDRPAFARTSNVKARCNSLLGGSITFHSQRAALDYIRYAAAQLLCDREILDACSGGDLAELGTKPCTWTALILSALDTVDIQPCTQDGSSLMGILWVLFDIVASRCLESHVLPTLEQHVPLMQRLAAHPGSMVPPWMVQMLLKTLIEARAEGRIIMHLSSSHDGSEEWTSIWENPTPFPAVIIGRSIATGASFCEITEIQ